MKDWITNLIQKWEPIVSKFQVQAVVAAVMVLATSGLVVASQNDNGLGVGTDSEASDSEAIELSPGEVGDVLPEQSPGSVAAGTTQASKPRVISSVKKGGLTITTTEGGVPTADLFTADENRIGITDSGGKFGKGQITICGHAATTFGPAFNTSPEDLDVYWRDVDDRGGVHGRNVVTSWENDNYDPATAVQAATACKEKKPFIFLGGIGFEQIPAVRDYVEKNHMFYIHHIARSDPSKKYSFAPLPTVEKTGAMAGDWVKRKFPNKKVGIIYRDSEFWIPGKDAFVKALGRDPVEERGVLKNQGSYQAQLLAMQQAGADLVFAWENALAQSAMVNEADGMVPPYRPQWIVFPFNLVTDTVGDRALNPVLHGISTWPAYSPGDYSGPFAEYADEIKRFEAAYKKHRDVPLTDIHWMTWLAWRSIHYTLDLCGRDCTRNNVVGLMITKPYGYDITKPTCPQDFTRNGREGGHWTSMFEAYRRPSGSVGWKHIQHCKETWE